MRLARSQAVRRRRTAPEQSSSKRAWVTEPRRSRVNEGGGLRALAGGTETTDGPGAKLLETGVGEGRVEVDAVKHGVDLDGGLDGGGEGALGTLAGGTETTDGPGAKLLETGVGDRTAKVACQRGRRVARARRRYGDTGERGPAGRMVVVWTAEERVRLARLQAVRKRRGLRSVGEKDASDTMQSTRGAK